MNFQLMGRIVNVEARNTYMMSGGFFFNDRKKNSVLTALPLRHCSTTSLAVKLSSQRHYSSLSS